MPQQRVQFQETVAIDWRGRSLRLLGILAMGTMLAACGRCGDFLPSSLSQIGACHSDPPPQQ